MESASCVQPLALTLNPLDTNAIAKEEGRDLVHGGSKQLGNQVGIKIRLEQLPMICKS